MLGRVFVGAPDQGLQSVGRLYTVSQTVLEALVGLMAGLKQYDESRAYFIALTIVNCAM
jgi:hypothetical protein